MNLDLIRTIAALAAAESAIEVLCQAVKASSTPQVAQQLLLALDSALQEDQGLTLQGLDAAQSDLVASEYQDAARALRKKIEGLLM